VIPVLPGAVLHRCLPLVPAADGITAPFTSQANPPKPWGCFLEHKHGTFM